MDFDIGTEHICIGATIVIIIFVLLYLFVFKEKPVYSHNDKLIVDGTVPNKLKEEKILTSRIGICTILRPEKIRLGSIFEGKIGTHILSDELSFLEVNKFNKKKLENFLI